VEYTIDEHKHIYAVWTAARAVQRSFTGATRVKIDKAINDSGLREPWPEVPYDDLHRRWARSIMQSLNCSYGRAAKIIAVYLKTTVVMAEGQMAEVVHPPIDGQLLLALSRDTQYAKKDRPHWRTLAWTKLDETGYWSLIESLRRNGLEINWRLERYWRS
jgi:hypothetical protein